MHPPPSIQAVQSPPPLLCSIPVAARQIGVSRSKVYELIAEDRIRAVKLGKSRLIVVASLYEFVETLIATSNVTMNGGWK